MMLSCVVSLQSPAYVVKAALPCPPLRARRSAMMMLDPSTAVQHVSSLLAGEGAETIGPVLLTQLGVGGGLFAAGTALHSGAFGEVDEPEEPGMVEGEIDIYRDSPLRYLATPTSVARPSGRWCPSSWCTSP